jgi:phospholipid-binding lipoprotein MlaA
MQNMMAKKGYKKYLLTAIATLAFSFTNSVLASKPVNPNDPYEPFNRVMFQFNEVLDRVILKPLGELYNHIMPKPLATGFTNFYNNIDTVPTVLNDVLQGNFYQATNDTWRLGVNSTVGLLGFVDVGSRIGLEPNSEDFGLTLAHWGYTNSNYLVLPFLGPGTVRDQIGFPINYYFLSIYPYVTPIQARYELYFYGVLVRRADLLRYEGFMEQAALDKYVFIRDAYMQHRSYLIERNKELGDPYLTKDQEENLAAGEEDVRAEDETKPISDL